MPQHLIFEGAELSGKSWVMSEVYNFLEPKYRESENLLDGCYWFNCDVGIFGSANGKKVIKDYVSIFKTLGAQNIIVEKLFLADKIYNKMYRRKRIGYKCIERRLKKMDFKIILLTFPEDEELIKRRIADRLNLYPHYQGVLKEPRFYIEQQRLYLKKIKKSRLPYLIIEAENFPDETILPQILEWIGEGEEN